MLTPKQEKFCLVYLETGNASEAYRQSYSAGKMKPETINRNAFALLENNKIAARVKELREAVAERYIADKGRTIKRLLQGQEFDVRRLYHPLDHPEKPGQLKQPYELDDDTAKAIVGVKYDKDGTLLEYKTIDVKGCAELIGKHLKLFNEVGSKENPLVVERSLEEIRARKAELLGMLRDGDQ